MRHRTIRISPDVWDEIVKRGRFGETPNDVLRRELRGHRAPGVSSSGDATEGGAGHFRHRQAVRRMSAGVDDGYLAVAFQDGPASRWQMPDRGDKVGIRNVRDAAVAFAERHGATDGQRHAVMKALTSAGYWVSR